MALGGGTFLTQNKVLPGVYHQFVSKATATAALSERGATAMAMELDWGRDNEIIVLDAGEFQKNSVKLFGYDYSSEKLKDLREVFLHAQMVYLYKLTSGGKKAENEYAAALYCGIRGNGLRVVIQTDVDEPSKYVVELYLDTVKVDEQTVSKADELKDNDYVTWKKGAVLETTAGKELTGGENGTADTAAHQSFLNKLESYPAVNAIGYMGTEESVKALYVAYAKRMRDEVGIKLQAVVYQYAGDSIACVNVKNQKEIVPWVLGVIAGTAVNKSASNMKYDGECTVNTAYTQKELEAAILSGEFVLHQVDNDIRVLEDINSLVSLTEEMGEVFQDNQTVRVIDNIAVSVANVFVKKYMGKVPNITSGRTSLWSDIVKIHQELNKIKAIEDFESSHVTVTKGDSKKSVVVNSEVTVANAMDKLYMRTTVA